VRWSAPAPTAGRRQRRPEDGAHVRLVSSFLQTRNQAFEQETHVGLKRRAADRLAEVVRADHRDRQALDLGDGHVDRRPSLDDELGWRIDRQSLREVDLEGVMMQARSVQNAAALAQEDRVAATAGAHGSSFCIQRITERCNDAIKLCAILDLPIDLQRHRSSITH
jgi:hypothetical protein